MPCCVAYNCSNRTDDKENKKTFHRFPKDAVRRSKWIQNLRRKDFKPSEYSSLCSDHFEQKCFYKYLNSTRLKDDAEPTLFSFPSHLQKVCTQRKPPALRQLVNQIEILDDPIKEESTKLNEINNDHTYAITESPKKIKRKLDESQDKIDGLKKKLKITHQTKRRLKEKVKNLQTVVDKLKEEKLISETCSVILENSFTGSSLEVMKQIVKGHSAKQYSPELRSFATTLNFYSAKAYNFVRDSFNLALPHPSQIRRWYSKIPCAPGFTEPAFNSLKTRVEKCRLEGKDLLCALTLDEMAIKQHVQWDGQQFSGFVDIGSGSKDNDNNPIAKDALVLMVIALNEGWKIPVGYFFIDALSGSEKANIVQECLTRLESTGVQIYSLTCDGPSSHFTMFHTLGASMLATDLKPSFAHPSASHNIHIILDVCHMLKLIRNTLADGGILKNKEGQLIKWDFLQKLHNLQNEEGLRLANKLRSAHVEGWRKQKMKVNLAAQALSASVADAIEFCHCELKLPEFDGCMPTVEFIRLFDKLFDILNSRNPLQRGSKAPMSKTNIQTWKPFLDTSYSYIMNLTDIADNKMTETRRKTGFIGFLVAIKSVQNLYNDLISPSFKYLLTYKLSQDHLELFFGAIRASCGANNNPTTIQFTSAYKRLLLRHQIKAGQGNCTVQDDTNLLQSITDTNVNTLMSVSDMTILRRYGLSPPIGNLSDHDYSYIPDVDNYKLSEYKEQVISYIAGYIVKSIRDSIVCEVCKYSLEEHTSENMSKFIQFKDRGGLCKPSDSVIYICNLTEKCFTLILSSTDGKLPQGKGLVSATSVKVLSCAKPEKTFPHLSNHLLDYSVNDNHINKLVKLISAQYSKIKCYHLGKKQNELGKPKIRKHFSKLILFNHQ